MGSATSKPRKKARHLPKVGTPANVSYEARERRQFLGGRWLWLVLAGLILVVIGILVLTL
jgi:hypothetical protein